MAVTAAIGEAMANLAKLVKGVEKAAKEVKEKAGDLGDIGAVVAVGLAGAVAAASQSNAAMSEEVERITSLLYTLAADIGDALMPVAKQVADGLEKLVASFQSLSPEVKASALDMAVWVAGAGLALGALGKMAGVVEAVAAGTGLLLSAFNALNKSTALASLAGSMDKVTQSMGGMVATAPSVKGSLSRLALSFGTLLVPLAAVAAALAGVVLLAGAVYAAWADSSTGLADFFRGLGEKLGQLAARIVDAYARAFAALGDFLGRAAASMLERVAALVRGVSRLLEPVARAAGFSQLADTFAAVSTLTGQQLLDTLGQGAQLLWTGARETAEAVGSAVAGAGRTLAEGAAYGLNSSAAGAKRLGTDIARAINLEHFTEAIQALVAQLTGVASTGKARIRQPTDKAALESSAREEAARARELAKLQEQAAEESHREFVASVRAEEAAGAAAFREVRRESEALADAAKATMESARAAMESAREGIVNRLLGGLGQLGDLINAGLQGFQAGGAYGAIIAVVSELLMQSEGFKGVIEATNGIIQQVADALGTLLEPLQPLLGAISLVIDGFFSALTPVFEMMGNAIKPLAPLIALVGQLLEGLAPLFEQMGKFFVMLMDPLGQLVGPVMKALFGVLKFVATVILAVARAIGWVWNLIVGAVQKVIHALSSLISWTGFDGLARFARSLDGLRVDTDAMRASQDALEGTTWESAMARAEETARVREHTQAVSRATEALTNVPSAWKRALRTFESENAQEGPTRPPTPTSPTAPAPEEPGDDEHAATPIQGGAVPQIPPAVLEHYERMRRLFGFGVGATSQSAPVTYNIVGYDIDAAMEQTRRDETLRQQRAGVRTSGSRIRLTSRFSPV
ncbi:hypothetical protein FJV41_10045 [Myxococcus llanfairpwllgwyngyllgogerychwyrndrobwllllantysiliogogogochensis]|uniref:Uncharacterized protein n=1 Tax=Myxococcus llanfairpwllgwyngyllgogerychwyrndrobwllllantysiliogogogochensis TaxID=2590453 RepID=A0A540X4F2_9BACT|nr:hypothetical protein [Myxococcus llanfairpwllgwyngyllgogerychwyrndrobwllllantysiliogogogochensis]TQF16122.1 hypothetical protein FJV41_10045 [Myxococcus llanfairpwllgwyngyllgogerychwyrndrobwllllantysiliogogogochensis]